MAIPGIWALSRRNPEVDTVVAPSTPLTDRHEQYSTGVYVRLGSVVGSAQRFA